MTRSASRLFLTACAAAMLFGSGPALAQVRTPALPVALAQIPEPTRATYPGTITIDVDATDVDRKIVSVRETIPVTGAGPLILLYPQWIPGDHGPVGPVDDLAGLVITANGQRLPWVRNTLNTNAFQVDVPAGVASVDVAFQWLTPIESSQGRIVITDEMLNIQWEKALLYPAGYNFAGITFKPTVHLPADWHYATALDTETASGGVVSFAPISLMHFGDSPLFAGKYYRQVDLDPGGRSPVRLNMFADSPEQLAATDAQIAVHRNLVTQADRLYGARHYNHYDFLMAITGRLGGIGLEHHRSSEDSVDTAYFTGWDTHLGDRDLLPHEYTHSWDGKFRRPADQFVPNYNTPMQDSLLWVYEGQTQYWGLVLSARSGLLTKAQAIDALAMWAAQYGSVPGRGWRPMQDTTNDPIIAQRAPHPWSSWQRSEDYYVEGALIWLDADTWIREHSNGRKSLDDFAHAFFGVDDGAWDPRPYEFAEVASTLNGVQANDWSAFLRARLDAAGADAAPPLDGLARGGYRLVFRETPNDYQKTLYGELERNEFQYSLGITTNNANRIGSVRWDSPAFRAGLTSGWDILAVNGVAASPKVIADAITAAKGTTTPIEMLVKRGDRFRTIRFDYHDGLRYPALERIDGTPDRIGDIFSPRRR